MDEQLGVVQCRGGDRRLKREAWERWVAAAEASDLSLSAFARQQGLPVKRLLKWRGKLRASAAPAPRFIQVTAAPAPSRPVEHSVPETQRIQIRLGTALILLPHHHSLFDVLRAVKETAC